MSSLAIYRKLLGAQIRSQLEYRVSFAMDTTSQFVVAFLDFLAIALIFRQLPRLEGWSLHEVAFLYGVSGVAFGICDLFVGSIERLPLRIRTGTFDTVLVRPLGVLLQSLAEDFSLRRVGKIVQAAGILWLAVAGLDVSWTAGRIAMVPVMVACGVAIFTAIFVIGAATTFWMIDTTESMNAFTYGGNMLTSYPLQVYGAWLRRLVGFGLGLAFVNFLPSLYVLDKPNPFAVPDVVRFASPLVAIVFVLVSRAVWDLGVRHYRSTGN